MWRVENNNTTKTANYDDIEVDADFIGVMNAIEDAYLNEGGPEATMVNQMEARRYLEQLGQRNGQPLHEFKREFDRRLQMCRGVNLDIPEKKKLY